jgi:hypothetical protein
MLIGSAVERAGLICRIAAAAARNTDSCFCEVRTTSEKKFVGPG